MTRDFEPTPLEAGFDPRIADWLEADPDRAPRETLETVLAAMPSIAQRRAHRAPWRFPEMFTPPRAAVAAILGVLFIGGAILLLQRPDRMNVGGPGPSPSTSLSPSASPSGSPLGLAIVELDGTVRQELGLPIDAWNADISADGSSIAFTTSDKSFAFCGGCYQRRYATVTAIGTNKSNFLYPTVEAIPSSALGQPAWSPDGTRLAFAVVDASGNQDVYVAELGSADAGMPLDVTLTRLTTDPAIDEFPTWTPDGETIVYANLGSEPADDSGFSSTQEIWRVAVDGGDPVRLTENDVPDTMPDVRSDGLLAFYRGGGEMWTMSLDGTRQTQLENVPGAFNPRWSPDGTKLAMLRYDPSERAAFPATYGLGSSYPLLEVIVLDLASHEITVIGPRVASDVNPVSWTPDGQALLINRYD